MSAGRRRRRAAQALPNKRVLVVAHENITNNYYAGNNRSCLVSNCLFRVGGAACMLSNRCAPRCRAQARRAGSSTASLVHAGLLCCCCISSGARELVWWWCDRYRTCAACLRARISSWGVPGSAGAWH